MNVELDGNSAEGVLTFAADGRKTVQGTLAADSLDLTPYISTVRLLTANERAWSNGPITLDGLAGIDLDLRLSAANVVVSNAKLGRTAVAANLRSGHLVVTVGEAQAYGGVIKGSLALANFDQGIDVKSQLQFTDVDLENCLGQLFGLRRLEGKGNIALAVEGTGNSVLAVTHTLNGTATLNGSNGALAGLNVEQLLRRLERRPLSGGGEFRSGRTPYDKISVALKITQGTVTVEEVKIESAAVVLALAGSASIPARELDLKGTAGLVAPPKPGAAPFELPFIVQGSWDDPIMLPDAEALIRRSGAAAPLLNAVRERRAREFGALDDRTADGRGPALRHYSGDRPVHRTAGDRKARIADFLRAARPGFDYHCTETNHLPASRRDGPRMHPLFRTLAKVIVASMVVGTIIAHFGITVEKLMARSRANARTDRGICQARHRLGLAECAAWLDRHYPDLVRGLPVSPAGQKQQRLDAIDQEIRPAHPTPRVCAAPRHFSPSAMT